MKKAFEHKTFKEQAQSLAEVIREMGNPFLHDNAQLLVLDSRDILNESVINTVQSVEKLGADQYKAYHQSVITDNTTSIHETIKKNNLPLFRQPTPKSKGKQAGQISMLKHDVELFSCLQYILLWNTKMVIQQRSSAIPTHHHSLIEESYA